MRKSKHIILYLPTLIISEIDKFIETNPPNFKYHKVYFYYLIHQLTVKQIHHKNDEFVSYNMNYLKKVTVSNIDRYITFLRKGEFIISDGTYIPKIKRYKYQINEKFIDDVTKIKLDVDSKLSIKVIKELYLKKSHYNRLEPHLKLMYNELMKMEFDYEKAKCWIEKNATKKQKLSYFVSINQIEDKRLRYFKRNKTNKRLDTNVTNLKSDLRQFLIGDYVSVDLKNSQPFILGIFLDVILNERVTLCPYLQLIIIYKTFGIKRIKGFLNFRQNQEKSIMANFNMYFNSVTEGVFYETFIDRYIGNVSRNDVKDIMFKVLFSKNEIYKDHSKFIPFKKEKEVFESVYTFIYQAVKSLKTRDNAIMPVYLQKIESYLFIDIISKELVENGIIPLTIHDSVIVKIKDQAKTIEIMSDIFKNQIGIIPKFKVENLKS